MRRLKWIVITLVLLFIGGFLEYTLPQHDIVRITGTEVIRQDFSRWNRIFYAQPDTGNVNIRNRDLRLVNAAFPDGSIMVYRNEDTGWGWPPYFKFDTSDIQAKAADLVSTRAAPRWAVVTHYGWRSQFLSIYPNIVKIREIKDPNITIIPWFNIFFFIVMALLLLGFYRMVQKFKRRRIDPVLEDMGETWDRIEDQADVVSTRTSGLWARFLAWLKSWQAKK